MAIEGANSGSTRVSGPAPVPGRDQGLAWDSVVASPNGETVASGAFNATLAAPSLGPTSLSVAGSVTRATVLPRVQMVGSEATLVHDRRVRYQEGKRLGEGGLGEVVRVEDQDIGRTAAMKRLRADVKSPATVARFVDEIRTVGQLEHPNIVPIHDVGVDEQGDYYFVMKYVDGETLETIIEKLAAGDADTHHRYGFEQRIQIFKSLLEAVAFAHAKGIVHRDIKPANVMVGRYGEVVLMDWGIAKQISGEGASTTELPATPASTGNERSRGFETQVGSLIGTPAYMAPEQARGEACDVRSDIYSLSALFYELLTHRHYLGNPTTFSEILEGVGKHTPSLPLLAKSAHQDSVPAEISRFVMDGLKKDPAHRFTSVQAMIDRLDRRAEGDFPIQCPITLTKRVTGSWARFVNRHPAFATLLFVAGLVLVGWILARAARA